MCSYATFVYTRKAAHGDVVFVRSYSFMFSRFHPWCYYFGIVQLVHNALLSLTSVLVRSDIAGQIMMMGMILLSLTLSHAYMRPCRVRGGDEIYIFTLSTLLLLILLNTSNT